MKFVIIIFERAINGGFLGIAEWCAASGWHAVVGISIMRSAFVTKGVTAHGINAKAYHNYDGYDAKPKQ